jgi:hypothetical protein
MPLFRWTSGPSSGALQAVTRRPERFSYFPIRRSSIA